MKIAYGDLIGGISGDMFVAALIDLGLPLAKLKAELKKIPTLTFALKTAKKTVHAVRATRSKSSARAGAGALLAANPPIARAQ